MPTNLAIDDRLLEEAQKVGGHRTKRETVTAAQQPTKCPSHRTCTRLPETPSTDSLPTEVGSPRKEGGQPPNIGYNSGLGGRLPEANFAQI